MIIHVMRIVGFANGAPCPIAGQFLKSFDFDANDGQGYGEFTPRVDEAMRFDDMTAALAFWKTVSKVRPWRPDGEPNRPLTASTVEVLKLA